MALLVFVALWLMSASINSIILISIIVLPFVVYPFLFNTYYTIENGNLLKFEKGGKSKAPVLSIPIATIKSIQIIDKKGIRAGLILSPSKYKVDDIKINIREVSEFIDLIKKMNAEVQILS